MVQPSSRREGFSTIPDVKWEDVGGLTELRKQFELYIVNRIKYPTQYEVIAATSILFPMMTFIPSSLRVFDLQ